MRLSEPITIYLAVGASFGVSSYLRAVESRTNSLRAGLKGFTTAILWPLVAAAILLGRQRHVDERRAAAEDSAQPGARIEKGARALVIAVNEMLEITRRSSGVRREEMERTLYTLRESAEQYAELSVAEVAAEREAAPAAYEMELARISGRRGDDLLVAGRCAHRRNLSRIKARYERERSRLLRALSQLRMEDGDSLPAYPDDAERVERRQMSEARLKIYVQATELFSLLEDAQAAGVASRLLGVERYGLQQLQDSNGGRGGMSASVKERCTEQRAQLICRDRRRETTFTSG